MLTERQRAQLLDLARAAVLARVTGVALAWHGGEQEPESFPRASGVFVTLKREGVLRGCLGTLECATDLAAEVARCAVNSAMQDPRFQPVSLSELAGLSIDISVLGPLEPLDPCTLADIVIGSHGLVVEQGSCRGVLLPQVASEHGWSAEQFVRQTCAKAGLPPDAWEHGAAVYRFHAEVFGD
jgi:uncharacterized protein